MVIFDKELYEITILYKTLPDDVIGEFSIATLDNAITYNNGQQTNVTSLYLIFKYNFNILVLLDGNGE